MVRQAAKGAVAAAAVGAAAAAARKLATHDGGQQEPREEPEQEPDAEAAEQQEPQGREPDSSESEQEPERQERKEPVAGASEGDARRVLDRAREELEDLLGRPVESVSALERTSDGWVLALEVVEVNRVPETMDVLASYEVELDGDLNLRRYERARRYHRARADDRDER